MSSSCGSSGDISDNYLSKMFALPNHLKLLLLTLCFGTFCLLVIKNTPTNKHKYFVRQTQIVKIRYEKIENQKHHEKTTETPEKLRSKLIHEFENRRNRIKYMCANLDNRRNSSLHKAITNMVIDVKHNLTWCPVYKSASSMWMKNFAVLSGVSTTQNFNSLHDDNVDYSNIIRQKFQHINKDEEKIKQIESTVKFIIVRHPFERLLSAYRDKLEHMQGREYYYKRYGQYITHRYRAKQSNLTNLEPSFTEFLRFIAKEKHFDEHWAPFFDSCQPCSIDYNFILKFESMTEEHNYFINENNLQYYLNYASKVRESTSSQGITNDLVAEKYFRDIPVQLLSKVYKIYELDFLLFSYSPAKYYYMTKDSIKK